MGSAKTGKCFVLLKLPSKPVAELTRINNAETAAAVLVRAQRISSSSGVRKIPPPVPVRPDSKPKPAPIDRAAGSEGWPATSSLAGFSRKRAAESSKTTPTRILKMRVGKLKYPPRKANGIESSAKGQKRDQEKCPARQNCH